MKNPLAGFTIVEVMIFLAVSSVLFIAAAGAFTGRSQQTQFTQAMQDLQSQFRTYANQVRTSYLGGAGQYTCAAGTTIIGGTVRPVLTPDASASTNQDCVLLGRALQVIPNNDTIYSYPVFGLRNVYNGAVKTDAFPSSINDAAPEPANNGKLPPDLVWYMAEVYHIPGGLTVKSSSLSGLPGSPEQDLFMLYSSLQNNNTTGNEIDAFSQSITFNPGDIKGDTLRSCIEGTCASARNAVTDGIWKLCLQNGGNKFGELQVKTTPTGITTSLNMDGCT
jgi:type II secretory pathway pseudopilin PulG